MTEEAPRDKAQQEKTYEQKVEELDSILKKLDDSLVNVYEVETEYSEQPTVALDFRPGESVEKIH